MNCSKCGGKIIDGCCISCGQLLNGNVVDSKKNTEDKFYLEKLFNDDFDDIYRNVKLLLIFILGPLYFSYRGYLVIGILVTFFNIIISLFNIYIISIFIKNPMLLIILVIFYLMVNRLIYCTFDNSIYILIDKNKIKRIKRKYKENYIEKITNYKHRKIHLLLTILFYLIPIILFAIIRRYQNGFY